MGLDDGRRLTAQEGRVAVLVGAGRSNKAVARELGVSIRTVEFHLGNVYRKLGIDGRTALANLVGRRYPGVGPITDPLGNLPEPPTPLVGRADQLAALLAAIEDHRLVTVVGAGGVGKSRLSLEAAGIVERESGESSWLVDLSTINHPSDVVPLVTGSLGLRIVKADRRGLIGALRHQRRLIVLDNCEHLVDEVAALVTELVARCPGVHALVASRERLDVAGEHIVALEPLGVAPVDGSAMSPAAHLYCARAGDADPTFEPGGHADAIEQLCTALDGLPLAIELAAAQLPAFSAADVGRRLDDRFALLARRRQRGGRHDSLWATIAWSYEQLTAQQQSVFRRLAVFVGDFDLAAAAQVTVGSADPQVGTDVGALVAKSLVIARASPPGSRYRMLDTIRKFGRTLLSEHGDLEVAEDRHLAHFLSISAEADRCVRGTQEAAGRAAFEADWHNLRTAMAHACAADHQAEALELLANVLFWAVTRVRSEVSVWAKEMMRMPALARAPICLLTNAYFANAAGHSDEGLALVREAHRIEEEDGRLAEPWLSYIAPFCVPMNEAIGWTTVTQEHDDEFWKVTGRLQEAIGLSYYVVYTSPDEAERCVHVQRIETARARAERYGNRQGIGYARMALGNALSLSEPERAVALYEQTVEIAASLGLELLLANTRRELARTLAGCGEWKRSLRATSATLRAEMLDGWLVDLPYGLAGSVEPLLQLGHRSTAATIVGWLSANAPNLNPRLSRYRASLKTELADVPRRSTADSDVTTIASLVADVIDLIPDP